MSQKGRPRPFGPHMPPQGASSHGLTHIFYNLELIKRAKARLVKARLVPSRCVPSRCEKLNKLCISKN
jgi:hypothetical protein